MVTVENLKYN